MQCSMYNVITPFGVLLLVYKPDTRGQVAPEGGGLINRNNTTKGVIKLLLGELLSNPHAYRVRTCTI